MTVELGASLDDVLGLGWAGRLGISLVGANPNIGRCLMLCCETLSESFNEDKCFEIEGFGSRLWIGNQSQ